MRSRVISAATGCLFHLRLFPLILRAGRRSRHFQILIFHRVGDERDTLFPPVPTRRFRSLMELLADHFTVLPLEEVVQLSAAGEVPPRTVCITFDDGYRDNYTNAFPILRELGLPATIFLATGALDGGEALWHDELFHAFRCAKARSLTFDGRRFDLGGTAATLTALHAVLGRLRSCAPQERTGHIERLRTDLGVPQGDPALENMLSWDQIREMSRQGISFGAHTVSHPILTALPPSEARHEIMRSKREIETRLGRAVTAFAYPNGQPSDFDAQIKRFLRDEGFRCAVTTIQGCNRPGTDPFELRRLQAWEPDPRVSALKLALGRFGP